MPEADTTGNPHAVPEEPDRAVGAVRAAAVLGVVLSGWLVTALVADGPDLYTAGPLLYLPWLAPVFWVLAAPAVFFLASGRTTTRGYLAARSRGVSGSRWSAARLRRLGRPAVPFLALWALTAVLLLVTGAGLETIRTVLAVALSPLWLLAVYALLTAATPLLVRIGPPGPLAVVVLVDLLRFGYGAPSWIGWLNVVAGWTVPWTLGAALAGGARVGRRTGPVLLAGGAVATAGLVLWAGRPASTAGTPGVAASVLGPPTLATVTLGLAQCGLALLLHEPLRRAVRRPAVRTSVRLVNNSATTLLLWHPTALTAVTATGLLAGRLPGLHTFPDGPVWFAARLAWLPVLAVALGVCRAAFRRHGGDSARPASTAVRAAEVDGGGGSLGWTA